MRSLVFIANVFATQLLFAGSVGQIVTSIGDTKIQRGPHIRSVASGMMLESGDALYTADTGGAKIYQSPNILLYLGAGTQLNLGSINDAAVLHLQTGELRVTTAGYMPVDIIAGDTTTTISKGIVRVFCDTQSPQTAVRIMTEEGEATTRRQRFQTDGSGRRIARGFQERPVRTGEEIVCDARGGFQSPGESDWGIQLAQYAVQGLKEDCRVFPPIFPQPCPPIVVPPHCPPADATAPSTPQMSDGMNPQSSDSNTMQSPDSTNSTDDSSTTDAPPLQDAPSPQNQSQNPAANQPSAPAEPPSASGDYKGGLLGGGGNVNLGLGGVSMASAAGIGGGSGQDAGSLTRVGSLTASAFGLNVGDPFPGQVHVVTSETMYKLQDINLMPGDGFNVAANLANAPTDKSFWSIGLGNAPTTQVVSGIGTASAPVPQSLAIPKFDAYIVNLKQYPIPDAADPTAVVNNLAPVTGFTGNPPVAPDIVGANAPLTDDRAQLNDRVTFAVGELAVQRDGGNPVFSLRRSDQDRLIIKDSNNVDANDQVTVNPDVTAFNDVVDPLFFPTNPTVKEPIRTENVLTNRPQLSLINTLGTTRQTRYLRKAAMTTLMADELTGYARRTGQTRFVMDDGGRQTIIDITGYKPTP